MRPKHLLASSLVLVLAPLAACSDSSGDGATATTASGGSGNTVTVVGEDSLSFDQDSYSAAGGEITFIYENGGSLPHTLLIEGVEGFILEVGDTDTGTVSLDAGEYVLFCDIPGHQGAGMEAPLTVT